MPTVTSGAEREWRHSALSDTKIKINVAQSIDSSLYLRRYTFCVYCTSKKKIRSQSKAVNRIGLGLLNCVGLPPHHNYCRFKKKKKTQKYLFPEISFGTCTIIVHRHEYIYEYTFICHVPGIMYVCHVINYNVVDKAFFLSRSLLYAISNLSA